MIFLVHNINDHSSAKFLDIHFFRIPRLSQKHKKFVMKKEEILQVLLIPTFILILQIVFPMK